MKEITKLHFVLSAVVLLLLVPACVYARIRADDPRTVASFFAAWVFQSVAWAGVLYQHP